MRILLIGAGGVGAAFTAIAARRDFFETVVGGDYDLGRAERAVASDGRFVAAQVEASSAESVGPVQKRGPRPEAAHPPSRPQRAATA